jgi:hypothetical protein
MRGKTKIRLALGEDEAVSPWRTDPDVRKGPTREGDRLSTVSYPVLLFEFR